MFGIDRKVLATFYAFFSLEHLRGPVFHRSMDNRKRLGRIVCIGSANPLAHRGISEHLVVARHHPDVVHGPGMAWFVCGFERFQRPAINLGSYLVISAGAELFWGWDGGSTP